MADNDKNHGKNRGPVTEGPSLHGDKTVSKLAENTNTPDPERGASGPRHDENEIRAHDTTGRDRLFEGREQHDEAEKNSEKTRHARDVDRHHHGDQSELDHRDTMSRAKRKN
jgi:hypothetical protein